MKYAKRHATLARVLAERPGGVTVKQLARIINRTERLAARIISDIALEPGFGLLPAPALKPGPAPKRLVVWDACPE